MRHLLCLILTACLALPGMAANAINAERQERFGDVTVHYSTFSSTYLQPQIARQAELVRSKQQGVINLSVIRHGQPQLATISGTLKSLTGRTVALNFRQIVEKDAIYYVAQYPVPQQETQIFDLQVETGGTAHRFSFSQELFPDP